MRVEGNVRVQNEYLHFWQLFVQSYFFLGFHTVTLKVLAVSQHVIREYTLVAQNCYNCSVI